MALPLVGIEAVLSSDDLQVASEDAVYDFVSKWAWAQYPKLEEHGEFMEVGKVTEYGWHLQSLGSC